MAEQGQNPLKFRADARPKRPENFSAAANGTTDDRAAMIEWAAAGGAGVVLELKPGATYRVASRGPIAFAAGSIVNGNGATILLDYTDTSDNFNITVGAGAVVDGVNVLWSGANYAERGIRLDDGSKWNNASIGAEIEQPTTAVDAGEDRTVILNGAGSSLDGIKFTNIWAVARVVGTDCSIHNCNVYGYGKGFAVDGSATGFRSRGNTFYTISSLTTQAPGEGAYSGAASGMVLVGNVVHAAGEHGFYISGSALATDVVVDSCTVLTSEQSGFKFRLVEVTGKNLASHDVAIQNKTGSTEDAIAFEDCPKVVLNGFTATGHVKNNAGQYTMRFDSCAEVIATGIVTDQARNANILITDKRIRAALGGYEHVSTLINGIAVQDPGNKRFVDIEFDGNCGTVEVLNASFSGGSGTVLTTDIAGTADKIMLQGAISTSGTMHTNTAGGASVLIEAFWDRYVGGSLQRSYVDGKFTMYSDQFVLTEGATLGQFVRSTGTEATGAYIGGYGGSRLNSGRPGWAMVGKQGTSDADQVGAAILVKQSSTTSDILVEAVEFAHNLHAKFAATVKTAAYAVSALPSASNLGSGARAMVFDGSVVAAGNFGNVVAGGGANIVPVYSDGTNWRIG